MLAIDPKEINILILSSVFPLKIFQLRNSIMENKASFGTKNEDIMENLKIKFEKDICILNHRK